MPCAGAYTVFDLPPGRLSRVACTLRSHRRISARDAGGPPQLALSARPRRRAFPL